MDARATARLGSIGVLALAGAACTYDYQGAIDGPSSTSSGGAAASSTGAGAAAGGGGAGASTSASSAASSSGSTSSTSASTGGPVQCAPAAGQLAMVNDNGDHGEEPWTRCGSGDLRSNVTAVDAENDCVELLGTGTTNVSHWLMSKFTFSLPTDAQVSAIEVDVRRRANSFNHINDRLVFIGPGGNDSAPSSDTTGPWSTDWKTVHYRLDGALGADDVKFVEFTFQVSNGSTQDVVAKVDEVSAKVVYASSACP